MSWKLTFLFTATARMQNKTITKMLVFIATRVINQYLLFLVQLKLTRPSCDGVTHTMWYGTRAERRIWTKCNFFFMVDPNNCLTRSSLHPFYRAIKYYICHTSMVRFASRHNIILPERYSKRGIILHNRKYILNYKLSNRSIRFKSFS